MVSHFDTTLLLIYSVRVAIASPIVGRCALSEGNTSQRASHSSAIVTAYE